jgi:hypothetical protein
MKRKILFATSMLLASTMILVTSCSKDDDDPDPVADTTAPSVTLNGSASETISLGGSYTDPGAVGVDNVDGSVTVTSDFSSTNPNLNRVNTYTVTYSATDAAGNVGTATRTIRVKNDAEDYVGTYNVLDSCGGLIFNYTQVISVDSTNNNRIRFNKWADYANNTNIYATKNPGDGSLEIPFQAASSIGSGAGACDIVDHTFASIGPSTLIVNGFRIMYVDAVTTGGCTGSTNCVAYYTKQ